MNNIKVSGLLEQWNELLNIGEQAIREKISKDKSDINGRIKRTTGTPVIFDFKVYEKQQKIQDLLCKELPQFADLIKSVPEIMDGHAWIRGDFIELYFEHYRLVIEKLRRLTNKKADM